MCAIPRSEEIAAANVAEWKTTTANREALIITSIHTIRKRWAIFVLIPLHTSIVVHFKGEWRETDTKQEATTRTKLARRLSYKTRRFMFDPIEVFVWREGKKLLIINTSSIATWSTCGWWKNIICWSWTWITTLIVVQTADVMSNRSLDLSVCGRFYEYSRWRLWYPLSPCDALGVSSSLMAETIKM